MRVATHTLTYNKLKKLANSQEKADGRKSFSPKNHSRLNSPIGVMEHTDWHDDIEQDLDRDLTRLANLAEDDHQRDPSKSAACHYNKRLITLLTHKNRRYHIDEHGHVIPTSFTAEPASPLKSHSIHPYKFDQLSLQVEELTRLLQDVTRARTQEKEDHEKLRTEVAHLAKIVDGKRKM